MKKLLQCIPFILLPLYTYSQGEIPVDMHTGQPIINIPIWSVSDHDISVPISLSYSSSAIKFDDYGGTYGMGWQLSGLSSVSRTVKGLPDDFAGSGGDTRKGWLSGTTASWPVSFSNTSDLTTACPDEASDHTALSAGDYANYLNDTEPDIFHYDIGGVAGDFVYDNSGVLRMIPMRDVKIVPTKDVNNKIISFTITTNTGYVYTFSDAVAITRLTTMSSGVSSVEFLKRDYELYKTAVTFNSEWKLTRIDSPTGASVNFTYTTGSPDNSTKGVSVSIRNKFTVEYDSKNIYTIDETVTSKTIASIYASSGAGEKLEISSTAFTISDTRRSGNAVVKSYTLTYKIFGDTGRKFLQTITETGGCDQLSPYKFTYQGIDLNASTDPFGTNTKRQDFWGYYNGVNSNTSLYPTIYVYPALAAAERYRIHPIPGYAGTVVIISGADRTSKQTDLGSLSSITYPSQGVATFDFEPNVFYDAVANQDFAGGGLRIKEINYYDALSNTSHISKIFTYAETSSGHSSGRLISRPSFAIPVWKYNDFGSPATIKTYASLSAQPAQNLWEYLTMRTQDDISTQETSHGSSVVYGEVKVARPNTGYVKFEYALPAVYGETSNGAWTATVDKAARPNTCPIFGIAASGTAIGGAWSYPYATNPNYEHERGLITRKSEYSESGTLVRSTDYLYQSLFKSGSAPVSIYGLAYEKFPNSDESIYFFGKYFLLADMDKVLLSETVKTYDDTDMNKYSTEAVEYTYGSANHKLLTLVKRTSADGTIYRSKLKYPLDFPGIPATNIDKPLEMIKNLQDNLRNGIPIEQVTTVTLPGQSEKTVAASLVKYNNFGTTKVLPEYSLSLSVASGVTNFAEAVRDNTVSPQVLKADTRYEVVNTVLAYDAFGLPLSQKGMARTITGTHWGFNKSVPVVQAVNAAADQFGFSDFETSTGNEFTIVSGFQYKGAGRTGEVSHYPATKLTRTVSKAKVSNYILSFWIKSNAVISFTPVLKEGTAGTVRYNTAFNVPSSGGTAFQHFSIVIPVTAVTTATMTLELQATGIPAIPPGYPSPATLNVIDDLAFYPETADLVSTTYAFPFGASSVTDARRASSFTSYDGLGRVKFVMDRDKNIVKKNSYVDESAPYQMFLADYSWTGSGYDAEPITFTVEGSDCIEGIMNYEWDFKDGSPIYTTTSKTVTHTFTSAGTYGVNLKINHATLPAKEKSKSIAISWRPLGVYACAKGVATYNSCTSQVTLTHTCASITTSVSGLTTAFRGSVMPFEDRTPDPGPFNYSWKVSTDGVNWTAVPGTQEVSRTLMGPYTSYTMKFTVTSQTAPYRTGSTMMYVDVNCN